MNLPPLSGDDAPQALRRVLVCGCSGSGKSTLARAIAARQGSSVISLDAHYWLPGWVAGGDERLRQRVAPLLADDAWVIDGNYFGALGDMHVARATHVVFFDLPRWFCLANVLRRILTGYGRTRPEMAPGCPERLDWDFLLYIWRYRVRQRPRLLAHFAQLRPDQRLLHFTRRRDAWAWFDGLDKKAA